MTSPEARRRLAALLRTARLDAGMSGEQLARNLGWSQSKVSKIENGRTRASREDVVVWLEQVHAPDDVHNEAAELAESALVEARHLRVTHQHGLTSRQREVADLEDRTREVCLYQPTVMPGLLQTAEYARQVFIRTNITGQRDVPQAVAARMERQRVLYKPEVNFRFVVTETVLRWRPDKGMTLAAQLDRLLSMATLPNVHLAVWALGRTTVLPPATGFTLFDVPEEPVVIVETDTRELIITDPEEVETYRHLYASAEEQALTGDDALRLIRDIWTELVS